MNLNDNIKNNIQRLRKERNVTQDIFAATLEISVQAVSKWETGASMPNIMQLPRIARFFGITIDYLFYNEGTDNSIVNGELPNDDTLRIIQFLGNKMLATDLWIKDKILELKIPDNISNGISKIDLNVEIWGSANIIGNISSYVECSGGVNCGNIGSYAECGGELNCVDIGSYAECGGDLNCNNIATYAECGGALNSDNIGGNAECGGNLSCGTISGNVECKGTLHCKKILGDVKCEGDILYEK